MRTEARRGGGDARPSRCRLRVGPGSQVRLDTEGVAVLELEGVHTVALDAQDRLVIDFDPTRLSVAALVRMLEFAGLIRPSIPWSVTPNIA